VAFVIEDDIHAEHVGPFHSFDAAMSELQRLAAIAWDQPPNRCPCTSWRTCEREYSIIEYDDLAASSKSLGPTLNISAKGVQWSSPD